MEKHGKIKHMHFQKLYVNRGIKGGAIMVKTLQSELVQGVIAVLIFALLLLTSCAGNGVRPETEPLAHAFSDTKYSTKAEKLNIELAQKGPELKKTLSSADYKIGPEDLLEINVFQAKELDTLARVSASGHIKLPLIDKIQASGLTAAELESLINKKLEKYLTEPVAGVFIKEYRNQQFAVLGSVKSPGVYYASGQRYLLDALSLAGGLSPDAGDFCIIQRASGNEARDGENIEKIAVDLDALLLQGRFDLNIPLYSGDLVHVPKSGIVFVDGSVSKPGSYPVKGKISITQVISLAGGLVYEAARSDIRIYRDNGTPERDVITIDYNSVLERKSPDIDIKDKDIIIVATSNVKRFLKNFSGFFNFGAFGISKGFTGGL